MDDIGKLFEIADFEARNGNFDESISAYKKIIELSKESDRSYHLSCWGIGEIYLNNQQNEEAISYLSKAVKLAPDQSYYQYLLGCAFTYSENIDMAINHLEIAVDLDDSHWEFWNQLGWIIGFNKDVDKGIEYLKKAISMNPQKSKSYRDLCMLYGQKRNWEAALLVIEEAIAADPDDRENYYIKSQMESFKNGFEKTEDEF